jgi:UDP-glucose 4-epimerase
MILVVGGAGYIGSHTNKLLNQNSLDTVVFDNLIYGHKKLVKWGKFFFGDLKNIESIREVFRKYKIEAVIHFAAYAYVEESVKNPEKYYLNNVSNTLNLLKVMKENDCKKIIFSSSCAVYGLPTNVPIIEDQSTLPINPYGKSKLMVENILKDYSEAYNLQFVALRYFNAAGADFDLETGEEHDPENHLIPIIFDVAAGKRKEVKIYGNDYSTDDGTAIRDYIHVLDIADAHYKALGYLTQNKKSNIFNLSNGNGYSVNQIVNSCKKITNCEFKTTYENRRIGDPPILIGSSSKAHELLKWKPLYPDIDVIIESAWKYYKKIDLIEKS